MREFK